MNSNIRNVLPETSFVPFAAYRLIKPKFVWCNSDIGSERELYENAYCLPVIGEEASVYSNDSKMYYADCYGSRWQGAHGGAGRCGTSGSSEIKGVGATPLVGDKSDLEHSYGGALIQEAIKEAIGGEICHFALPFGAARARGIIITGSTIPTLCPTQRKSKEAVRALIIRGPVIRPAHFMRAPFFKQIASLQVTDVQRTKAAIGVLFAAFQAVLNENGKFGNCATTLADCLLEMSRRFAAQIAAAQAKRIVHGALTPANIAIDGKWIDFGTLTIGSDYGRLSVAKRLGTPDGWWQFTSNLETLRELVFSVRKYHMGRTAEELPKAEVLIGEYLKALGARLRVEFLKLTGIPETSAMQISTDEVESFSCVIQRIITRGNRSVFNPLVSGMPARTGAFHLNTILRIAVLCRSPGESEMRLAKCLPDGDLRTKFMKVYWALRYRYSQSYATLRDHGDTYLRANAVRVNKVIPDLLRPELDRRIDALIEDGGSIEAFVEGIKQKAKIFLSDPEKDVISLLSPSKGEAVITISPENALHKESEVNAIIRQEFLSQLIDGGS